MIAHFHFLSGNAAHDIYQIRSSAEQKVFPSLHGAVKRNGKLFQIAVIHSVDKIGKSSIMSVE